MSAPSAVALVETGAGKGPTPSLHYDLLAWTEDRGVFFEHDGATVKDHAGELEPLAAQVRDKAKSLNMSPAHLAQGLAYALRAGWLQ